MIDDLAVRRIVFPHPHFACIRAGRMGRYYASKSGSVQRNDFVMTTGADVFPIDSRALLSFLHATNGRRSDGRNDDTAGDYHHVCLSDWEHTCDDDHGGGGGGKCG